MMYVKGFLVNILYLIITIVHSLKSNGTLNENFYHFSIKSTSNLRVLTNESINIKCPIFCHNCTKPVLMWYYKGHLLEPGDNGIESSGSSLHIKYYNTAKHSGNFSCILSFGELSMRSPDISVKTINFPEFLIEDQLSYINGIAVFTCHDVSKLQSGQFHVKWYKNGKLLEESRRINIIDNMLLIKNIFSSDVASYHCQLSKSGFHIVKESKPCNLQIQKALKLSPSIRYVTQHKEVQYNTTFTIFCSTKGLTNAVVSLYKRSSDGRQEFKLKKSFNYIAIKQHALQSTFYVCEAENGNVRAKEEISVTVYGIPRIEANEVLYTQQYLGRDVSFDCKVTGNPFPVVSWYHNGRKVTKGLSEYGTWLTITRPAQEDSGIYQCIGENAVGAVIKYTYLALGMSGLTPRNFEAETNSSTQFSASWEKPQELDGTKNHSYHLMWTSPDGVNNHLDTTLLSALVNKQVYGGLKYSLKLCLVLLSTENEIKDCVYRTILMPESAPVMGPVLKEPTKIRKQFFNIAWQLIPKKYAMGTIQKYIIYCKVLDGQDKGLVERFEEPIETSSVVKLDKNATYKIWMTASTSKGESPKSNEFIVQSDILELYDNVANLQVEWKGDSFDGYNSAVLTWHVNALTTSDKYKVYCVRIPYNNYWKEVRVFTVSDSQSLLVEKLDVAAKYRFTFIPVKRMLNRRDKDVMKYENEITDNDVKSLGRTSSTYLLPKAAYMLKDTKSYKDIVPAPNNLTCIQIDDNQLRLSWAPIKFNHSVRQYKVRVFSDLDGVELAFLTHETNIPLGNLTKGFWYGVQVQGYSSSTDVLYQKSLYKSCRTKERVPSAVRDVKYSFVYNKEEGRAYLHLSWRPPLYTGASTYSYEIVRRAENKNKTPFPFPPEFGHLIMEKQGDDDRIHYEAMWTESAEKNHVRHTVKIVAINDVGIGEYYENRTYFIMHPSNTKPSETNHVTVSSPTSSDNRMGIAGGISISVFFLLVLVVICAVKEPWKKDTDNAVFSNEGHDQYLYTQKLQEIQTVSMDDSSRSNSGVGIATKNKVRQWKFFQLIRPFHQSYQPANSSDLSSTVLYSSGSSSSGSRANGCSRSKCHSQLGSSSGLQSLSDRTSEGKITFISESAST